MRPTCTFCARKHLAQAVILVQEALMGYPTHIWLAIGHMAEASDELVGTYPEMANTIRTHRKALELNPAAVVPFMDLIDAIGKLATPHFVTGMSAQMADYPIEVAHAHGTPEEITPAMMTAKLTPVQPVSLKGSTREGAAPIPLVITDTTESTSKTTGVPAELPLPGVNRPLSPSEMATVRSALEAARQQEAQSGVVTEIRPYGPDHVLKQAPSGPGAPCLTCVDKAVLSSVAQALNTEERKPRLAIMTTLADFNPSYSLVGVILEQAHAAVLAGYRVFLLVHRGANLSDCPPLPPEISLMPVVPTTQWKHDTIEEAMVDTFYGAMREWFQVLVPPQMGHIDIITHDLLFQAAYTTFAKAIHRFELDSGDIVGRMVARIDGTFAWYHMAHSSIGPRPEVIDPHAVLALPPTGQVADATRAACARWYRCTLPPGHRLMVLNYADVPYFRAYYALTDAESIVTLLNSKDIRPYLRMSQTASMLTTRFQLHSTDVTMIYPLSLMRAFDKGVDKVLMLLGGLKRLHLRVRLLLITAHANDRVEAPQIIERIKSIAKANGLTTNADEATWIKATVLEKPIYMPAYGLQDVILTCEALPDTAAYGLRADDVRSLWGVSNLFVFPTISEAGSLVLMEAALAGVTLVLNQSLPALADYIPAEQALWVPWGSLKQQGQPPETFEALDELAGKVWERMAKNEGMIVKRGIMQKHSLEAYGRNLKDILSPPVPIDDEDLEEPSSEIKPWTSTHRFKVGDTVTIYRTTNATSHLDLTGKTAIVQELQAVDGKPWYYLRCDSAHGAMGSLPEWCLNEFDA